MRRISVAAFAFFFISSVPKVWGTAPSGASTYTVDSVNDDADNNPSDNLCSTDSGQCTLRAAIQQANAHASGGEPDVIAFNIHMKGDITISPGATFSVTDPVVIDGTTQSDSLGRPMIELDGSAIVIGPVLDITAGGSTVKGLAINRASDGNGGQIQIRTNGGNVIQGNFLGTDTTGMVKVAGSGAGILVINSPDNLIGGTTEAERNIIGVTGMGIDIFGTASRNNRVLGNYIGVDKTGTAAFAPGGGVGVVLGGGANILGGTVAGSGNVIGGSLVQGVHAGDFGEHVIQGNFIGTDAGGTLDLGNDGEGILVGGSDLLIGGSDPGAGNVIAFNGASGVSLNAGTGNTVISNSIFSNAPGGPGIDLLGDGVTPNDDGDADSGPNNLQNAPVLTSITADSGLTIVGGTLSSKANTNGYLIQVFLNDACSPSGRGDGRTFLGDSLVNTGGDGKVSFEMAFGLFIPSGKQLTATATDPSGNTSEFSACLEVYFPYCGNGIVDDGEECDEAGGNNDMTPDACRQDCRSARCGDGVVDTGEACDDGGAADGDGCNAACETETGAGEPSGESASGTSGAGTADAGTSGGCSLVR